MEAGTVVEWLKESGDPIEAGEMLFSVESDKAITEVEALDSGVLYLPPDTPIGVEVPVGAMVGWILAPGEEAPAVSSQQPAVSQGQAADGRSHAGEALTPEGRHGAPTARGVRGELAGQPGGFVAVSPRARRVAAELGVDLSLVSGSGRGGRIREADVRAAAAVATNGARPRVSPSVRRMAEEAGVDIAAIPSTGPAGRVTRADLLSATARAPLSLTGEGPGVSLVPMSPFRKAISQRMTESARTVAPVTLTTEVDATDLVRVRESLRAELAASGEALPSYNDLLIRIVARALRMHPELNASLDGDRLIGHEGVHIGLAVDTERGLLAPVVRDADRLGVFEISAETKRLIASTRDGSVSREELTGSTFTITNLGMFDIDAFTPIINLPEAGVLGVGRIVAKPVVVDESTEQIAVRKMLSLSLTFDHRVVDGAPAAKFLQQIKQMVETPLRWMM
jgi:pyruvate dehydrogenase E2 component (dihydrolipoamide acetyltransferase)